MSERVKPRIVDSIRATVASLRAFLAAATAVTSSFCAQTGEGVGGHVQTRVLIGRVVLGGGEQAAPPSEVSPAAPVAVSLGDPSGRLERAFGGQPVLGELRERQHAGGGALRVRAGRCGCHGVNLDDAAPIFPYISGRMSIIATDACSLSDLNDCGILARVAGC